MIKKRVCVKWQQTDNVFNVNTKILIYLSCLTIRTKLELERIQGEGGGNEKQNGNIFLCSFDFNTSSLCLQFFFTVSPNFYGWKKYIAGFVHFMSQWSITVWRGWSDIVSASKKEQEYSPPLQSFIPFLPPSLATSFWAAQSRMRVILPMSSLQC